MDDEDDEDEKDDEDGENDDGGSVMVFHSLKTCHKQFGQGFRPPPQTTSKK